ncbi:sporulation protein rmd1 [Sporothrix curviconia]|uniref:Sporulation protein rmd1 n=1 Tax=Sporothrix curviconia TaxID=1260050 RepID=A0ABP0B0V8_9PEZI
MDSSSTQEASDSAPLLQPASPSSTPSPSPSSSSPNAPPPAPQPAHALPALSTPTKQQLKGSVPPVSPSALARPGSSGRPKAPRTVTFDPNPVTRTIEALPSTSPPVHAPLLASRGRGPLAATASTPALNSTTPLSYGTTSGASGARAAAATGGAAAGGGTGSSGPPVLAAINNRLRRRNSYGSGPLGVAAQQQPAMVLPKIGPQRSTKNAQKLKLLPNPEFGDEGPDEESGRDVYSQYTRIKDPTARRDAALLGKADRARLPRVTAYCTANRYEMDGLMRFLKGRGKTRGGNPKLIDECIYTPYDYNFGKNNGGHGGADGGHSHNERVSHHSYIGGGSGHARHRGVDEDAEHLGHKRELQQQQEELQREQEESEQQQREQQRQQQQQEQQEQQQRQLEQEQRQDLDRQDSLLLPASTYYQERRHSAGEVDADRDDLIDLDGPGLVGNVQRNDVAVLDEDEILLHRPQQSQDGGRYFNSHLDRQQEQDDATRQAQAEHQEQEHHQIHRHQRQAEQAVMELMHGDDLEREAVVGNSDQLRGEFEQQLRGERPVDFDINVHTPELFLFDYGVVVIWGMTEVQEQRFLKELAKFELEKLAADDMEAEFFNFYYTREYQARIYNDFIALRDKNNYMTKLAISHALAQSVKTSLFEELIASTVETCKDIPAQIANTGTIALSRTEINMQIGELFILRINIHLNGSVLDTPELFWVEPQLEPVYQAVRSYLEMDQRVGLLTQRLDVIADLLAVLKEQLSHGHGEKLEWIVIILIAAEILVAAINIVVDLYAGV